MQLASHGSCRNTTSLQQRPLWTVDRCAQGAARTPQFTGLTALHPQQHNNTWPSQLCLRLCRQTVECAAASWRRDAGGAAPQPEQRRSPPRLAPAVLPNYPFTLHQLVVFSALAAAKSPEAAAALLNCSKQNIHVLMSNLEFELGRYVAGDEAGQRTVTSDDGGKLKLVQPVKKESQLTPAGRLLQRYSHRMISLAADALAAMRDLQNVKTGQMAVAASQTTGVYLMPPLIERFKQKHREVTVQLEVENTARCCAAVSRGEVDVAVVGGQIPADLEHLLQVTPYQKDEVVVVLAANHPLAGAGTINVDQLYSLKFVSLHKSTTVQGIRSILEAHSICWTGLQVVMEVNSVEAIKMAVQVGLGAAFVSRAAVQKELQLGLLAAVGIEGVELQRELVCVTDPVRYCSHAVRAFIREMFGITLETSAIGCFLPPPKEGGRANGTRYPELRGRAPHIADLSPLSWGQSSADQRGEVQGRQPVEVDPGLLPQLEKLPFTLQQAINFRMCARSGAVKQAAMALGVSPGAVSRSIALLEQAFGGEGTLLGRTHGRVVMTEAGQLFLTSCEAILSVASEACRALQDYSCANTGVVCLGACQTTGTYLMPRLISVYRQRNQNVALQLQVDQSRRICDAVAGGELDVAIIGGEVPPELQTALKTVTYAEDQLVLIAPRDHPVLQAGPLQREQLYSLRFVCLNEGSTVQTAQAAMLRRHGIAWRRLQIDMEFNSMEAIKSAVQHGLGVAFVSVMAIEKELQLGLLGCVPIAGVRLARPLLLVTSPARTLSSAAQKFMQEIFAIDPAETDAEEGTCCGRMQPVLLKGWQRMPWEAAPSQSAPHEHLTPAAMQQDLQQVQQGQQLPQAAAAQPPVGVRSQGNGARNGSHGNAAQNVSHGNGAQNGSHGNGARNGSHGNGVRNGSHSNGSRNGSQQRRRNGR